jgi:hypothetical protein
MVEAAFAFDTSTPTFEKCNTPSHPRRPPFEQYCSVSCTVKEKKTCGATIWYVKFREKKIFSR